MSPSTRTAASSTAAESSFSWARASSAISIWSSPTKNGRTSGVASDSFPIRVWMSSATAISRPSSPSDGDPDSTPSASR